MKRILKILLLPYWNFSNEKHEIIKAFDSRQFHDQLIDGFDFFCITTNYKTSVSNHKSSVGNFKAAGGFKIVRLTTSNKFQAKI